MSEETTTETTETTEQAPQQEAEVTESADTVEPDNLEAELAKWKEQARKHERRAKDNAAAAKELDEIKKSQLTDQEKLVAEARQSTLQEVAGKLVDAEFKAATQGRFVSPDAALAFDRKEFISPDGEIDSDAIRTWVESNTVTPEQPKVDLGQGNRGTDAKLGMIRSRDELQDMSSAEILKARQDGRLDYHSLKN